MKKWIWILLIGLPGWSLAQADSSLTSPDTVGYIYLEGQSDTTEQPSWTSVPGRKDFYRNMMILRLPLSHHQNEALLFAKSPVSEQRSRPLYAQGSEGLVMNLIEGLRSGKIHARHPQQLSRSYDYFDLVYDLIALQGLDPDDLYEDLAVDELGWEFLSEYVDLVVEQGFSQDQSKPFMRIRYIRLLWYNPQSPRGLHTLALIPYKEAKSLLAEVMVKVPSQRATAIQVDEFLDFRMFYCQTVPVEKDQALNLPPKRRSPEALKNLWPELWNY